MTKTERKKGPLSEGDEGLYRAYAVCAANNASLQVVLDLLAAAARKAAPPRFIKFERTSAGPCYIRLDDIESVSNSRIWIRNKGGAESLYDDLLDAVAAFEKALKED